MHQFWKTIDANYFTKTNPDLEIVLSEVALKTPRVSNLKTNLAFNFETPSWIPSKIAEIVSRIFKKGAFEIGGDVLASSANFVNFLAQFWSTYLTYGRLMRLLNQNKLPCEKCISKFILIFESKFKLNLERNSELQKQVEKLQKETNFLKSILKFEKCETCQWTNLKLKSLKGKSDFKATNQARIQALLQLSKIRKERCVSMRTNLSIFKEVTLQKEYLLSCLIFLERKILAGSIFKIHFARKNNSVELLLSKNNLKVSVKLKELLDIDKFRENSLFRIGKTSFKCHNSFYSYNVF